MPQLQEVKKVKNTFFAKPLEGTRPSGTLTLFFWEEAT